MEIYLPLAKFAQRHLLEELDCLMALQYISFCLPLVLLILTTILVLKQKSKQLLFNRGANLPPSPPRLPIIGNLHQLGHLPHQSLWNLSKQYGPIMLMKFGCRPTLVVSSAEFAREILKTHDVEFCSRPSSVGPKRLSYNFLNIAFVPYGEYWREMRKISVQELFSGKRVQSFRFVREDEVACMIKSISEYSPNRPVNLTKTIFTLLADIICRIAFGKSYRGMNFDDHGTLEEVLYEAMDMLASFAATDFFPYIGWIVDRFTGLHGRLEKCFHVLDKFYQQLIDEHIDPERAKSLEEEDIIDVLLGLQKDQHYLIRLTNDHIKAILLDIFIGGVDTSAVTMVWAMTELAKNPKIMKKVQEEIRTYVGKKGKVEESDIDQLQYLKMVVKETLRLHPPSVLLIPRESMKPCKISGYDVYLKTTVLVNVWAIGRSSDYWKNPNEFFPERFMNNSIDFKGKDFEFLPFGAGRRGCPALNMGIATIELGLANLLYSFDWELPHGMKNEDIDMEEAAGLTVHKKSALHLVPVIKHFVPNAC